MNGPTKTQKIMHLHKGRDLSRYKTADRFFESNCYEEALLLFQKWLGAGNQGRGLILLGEAGSGKTHLAKIWAEREGAHYVNYDNCNNKDGYDWIREMWTKNPLLVLENLHALARKTNEGGRHLMDILSDLQNKRGRLLITSQESPNLWTEEQIVSDVRSRLLALQITRIGTPEVDLMHEIMLKGFLEQGIVVNENAIQWLAERIPRSFSVVQHAVQSLTEYALTKQQGINFVAVKQYYSMHYAE